MPAGRPKILITQDIIDKARQYAAQGLTKQQIAQCLGMSYTTLKERQNEYPAFLSAIKEGQAEGIQVITNALFESAKTGNITAQIFYLKNRDPMEWRDRREIATEDITKKPIEMSDAEILAELRSHKEDALGTGSKTTH